jgi:hypothetical protein
LDSAGTRKGRCAFRKSDQLIFYPGGYGEAEILLAYAAVRFAASVGQLAGNPFLSLTDGLEQLPELGRLVLWQGAQDVYFERA